ncbi:hypothetical protein M569_15666, partial [Genlisea aurea]
ELLVGFTATPDPGTGSFQELLTDSTGNYSLCFLRVQRNQLNLGVIHRPSEIPVWSAAVERFPNWDGGETRVLFNGSLVLASGVTGEVYWSTQTSGDRVFLSDSSNLVVQKFSGGITLWQSFDFPSDTLVENQNFTPAMALVSANGLYSMKLGHDFFGLYQKIAGQVPGSGQMYFRHGALQAKAEIRNGQPVYLILEPDGFLGMFQNSLIPVDVLAFNTFQRNMTGNRRVRLESDGNLKAYYWTGSGWVLDYQAITDFCDLPRSCGSYGLCRQGAGCSCLDNRTEFSSGGCAPAEDENSGGLCGGGRFKILRRSGVELPFKELMGYRKTASMEACEATCAANCTCWGVVYSNSSGFCYSVDYPVETLVAVDDGTKMGYFKVREGVRRSGGGLGAWFGAVLGAVFGVSLILLGIIGVRMYILKRRGIELEEGMESGVGPYKDLGSESSRSIEL